MKKHDENKDIRLVSRVAKLDYSNKTINANTSALIGNGTWGRIDYLCHYCGWTFIWNNMVSVSYVNRNDDNSDKDKNKNKSDKSDTIIKRKREMRRLNRENNKNKSSNNKIRNERK
uniref:Uncharacterized protein n=1 Tax=Geladintestivirus 2 TaxID=3233134 RepID=A0AAU8MIG3_9CAUD